MIKKLDDRLVELLNKRGIGESELPKFLNPSYDQFRDPFLLDGMQAAVERIKQAVENNDRIVVYGDYDCDGVCASTIMYEFLKSLGLQVDVYIPSRFDDGYGLTSDMINEIVTKSNPNLLITVDLGISAKNEVETLKSLGVDVIITDHHEQTQEKPDTIVVDPKVKNQKYGFEGLCGAGVALKVVQAYAGLEEAKKYIDVCALATVGDIVPLLDENRVIVKKGLEKIQSGDCHKSIKFLLEKLDFKNITSIDLSFRVVPKLNASGRMDKGIKVFKFLTETDEKVLSSLFDEIDLDNQMRLECIDAANEEIEKQIHKLDLRKHKIIILRGKFHEGVLGILASRVMHEFNRPCIVFTESNIGTYKGSGRSLESINILEPLIKCQDLLVRFGGHTQAAGVEVKKENFKEFLVRINEAFSAVDDSKYLQQLNYDIEITEDDISLGFIEEIAKLEPFGCSNEKPVLCLKERAMKSEQLSGKNCKHLRVSTLTGKKIIAFNHGEEQRFFASNVEKSLIIDIEKNEFRGKTTPQGILREVRMQDPEGFEFKNEYNVINSFVNKYQSLNIDNICKKEYRPISTLMKKFQNQSQFGTIIIIDSQRALDQIDKNNLCGFTFTNVPLPSRQNAILLTDTGVVDPQILNGYKNVVFTRTFLDGEHNVFAKDYNTIEQIGTVKDLRVNINKDRAIFGSVYKTLQRYAANIQANNFFEFVDKIKRCEQCLGLEQICFSTLVFIDLGLVFGDYIHGEIICEKSNKKLELGESVVYNLL